MLHGLLSSLVPALVELTAPEAASAAQSRAAPAARAAADQPENGTFDHVQYILDASSSMRARFGTGTKFEVAREMLETLDRQISRSARPAPMLWAYGARSHRLRRDCGDAALLATDRSRLASALALVGPRGVSPLIVALDAVLGGSRGRGSEAWILFTDGADSCGRDVCAWVERLAALPRRPRIHVVGLGLTGGDARALRCLAGAGEGLLLNIQPGGDWQGELTRLAAILQNLGFLRVETPLAPADALELRARVYGAEGGAAARTIRAERDEELPGGTYRVVLETLPPVSFDGVLVRPGGKRTLATGDLGRVVVRVLSPSNEPVPAYASLTPDEEEPSAPDRPGGEEVYLPASRPVYVRAGRYRLAVEVGDSIALRETLEVRTGELRTVSVGGTGFIRAQATGLPDLDEVEVQLQDYVTGESSGFHPWREAMPVAAGRYRAVVHSLPPYVREDLTVAPAETTVLGLRGLGILQVDLTDSSGRAVSAPVTLIRPEKEADGEPAPPAILGTFLSGVRQAVMAGTYDLLLEGVPSLIERGVRVRQGAARVLSLAVPASVTAEEGT